MRWIIVFLTVSSLNIAQAALDRSPYGLNGISAIHARTSANVWDDARRSLKTLQECGAKWDRIELWWSVVQPAKNRWDFSFADKNVALYKDSGINLLCVLSYSSNWAKSPPSTDEERAEFAEYVRQIILRYKHQIKVWEIWNEPNIPTFWNKPDADQYAKLLISAYKAAKQADPTCTILAGSTSGPDIGFLRSIYKAGAWAACDAISIHPYSMAGGPEEQQLGPILDSVNDFISSTGRSKPLWITELGWTASTPADEIKQAAYLVQSYLTALTHDVAKLFWFKLSDFSEKWGIIRSDNSPKEAYRAYATLTTYLPQPVDVGPLFLNSKLNARVIRSGNTSVIAIWSRNNQSIGTEVPLSKDSKVIDALGRKVSAVNGSYEVGEIPIFVINAPAESRMRAAQNRRRERRAYLDSNTLVNADFELLDGKQIHGWNMGVFDGSSKDGQFFVANGRDKDNHNSAGIKSATDASWDSWPIPIRQNRNYKLTGWAKSNASDGTVQCGIYWYSGNMWRCIGANYSELIPNDGKWHRFYVRGKGPEDAVFARVRLTVKDTKQEALFDDLVFQMDSTSQ